MRQSNRRQSNRRRPHASTHARYDSLSDFYAADPRRVRSRERDVGLWWREDVGGPLHRAAWVADTGELYLVRLGPEDEGGGAVEVLANVLDGDRLERALRGWRERCGERHSLGWLRARAARLNGAEAQESSGTRTQGAWRTDRRSMGSTIGQHASDRGRSPAPTIAPQPQPVLAPQLLHV